MLASKTLSRFVQKIIQRCPYQKTILMPHGFQQLYRSETILFHYRFCSSQQPSKLGNDSKSMETNLEDPEVNKNESLSNELPKKKKSSATKSSKKEKVAKATDDGDTDTANKPIKAEKKPYVDTKYRNIHALVLLRVIRSCLIYLDATDLEMEKIDENSRFFYIKKEIDLMDFHQRKEFRVYLNQYLEFMYQKKTGQPSDIVASKLDPSTTIKTSILWYRDFSKKKVEEFLGSNEHGQVVIKLILEFLNEDNPDFNCYIGDEDEVSLGKKKQRNRKIGERTKSALTNDLSQTKESFRTMLPNKTS